MNLDGHRTMTATAVRELQQECSRHPLTMGLDGADLDSRVVLRDLFDVANTGHWQDFAQRHHFMRRFDNQTPFEAYQEGVDWIRVNARASSIQLMRQIPRYIARSRQTPSRPSAAAQACGLPSMHPGNHRAMLLYTGSATEGTGTLVEWQTFGNALHALQDSFAAGHVRRAPAAGPSRPGAIQHILRYQGHEREGHADMDRQWRNSEGRLSPIGRLAVNASKELIRIVLAAALNNHRRVRLPESPFDGFQRRWLAAAPELSRV